MRANIERSYSEGRAKAHTKQNTFKSDYDVITEKEYPK